jgi:hypothetical protein
VGLNVGIEAVLLLAADFAGGVPRGFFKDPVKLMDVFEAHRSLTSISFKSVWQMRSAPFAPACSSHNLDGEGGVVFKDFAKIIFIVAERVGQFGELEIILILVSMYSMI